MPLYNEFSTNTSNNNVSNNFILNQKKKGRNAMKHKLNTLLILLWKVIEQRPNNNKL